VCRIPIFLRSGMNAARRSRQKDGGEKIKDGWDDHR
jgi:hypothetical protein